MWRSAIRGAVGSFKPYRRSWIQFDTTGNFPVESSAANRTLVSTLDHVQRCFSSSKSTKATIKQSGKTQHDLPPKVSKTHKFSWENASLKPLNPETVYSTLRKCPSGLLALNFFMWCAKQRNYFHDAEAIDHMVAVVEKLSVEYEDVRGIIRGLQSVGCVIKPQVFLLLVRIYWRGGMYDKIFEVYEYMGEFGYVPNTLIRNVIMDVCFKEGCVHEAMGILNANSSPNFLTFNIALDNLCKIGDFVNLEAVIRMMMRRGFYPNPETVVNILNGFCKLGRITEGFQVLGLMICLGISVSLNVWNILINGFFRARKSIRATELFDKMIETGCLPNSVTYTILIKGLADSGMVNDTVALLNTVKATVLAPDLVLCNVMIDLFMKIGQYDDALEVFKRMSEQKLLPDRFTFSSVVSNASLSRRFDLFAIVSNCNQTELDLISANSLLNYFLKTGDPSSAVKLYEYMEQRGLTLDSYSFTGLLYALCREGRVHVAVNVYNGWIRESPHLLDAHVHTAIINGLIRIGKCNQAISLFRQCISKKFPVDVVSFTLAVRALVLSRRIEEAYSLFSQMKELGVSSNARTYSTIIFGLCKAKDAEKVAELLREITVKGIELDERTMIRVYKLLSSSRQYMSEFDRVFRNLDAKDDIFIDTCRNDDLSDVATCAG